MITVKSGKTERKYENVAHINLYKNGEYITLISVATIHNASKDDYIYITSKNKVSIDNIDGHNSDGSINLRVDI